MRKVLCIMLFLVMATMSQQALAVTVTANANADQLVAALLGSAVTVVPGSAVYTGAAGASGTFTDGGNIGIGSGVLLTSGGATIAQGPNNVGNATLVNAMAGYAPLNALIPGYSTLDASILAFSFTTSTNNLYFNYVFGSEEYNEYVGSIFNDVFAFFLDGTLVTNNIATLPDGTVVAINTINNGSNSAYYRDNTGGAINTQYDGLTTVLQASALGLSAGTHTIVLAIADSGDYIYDSGVFLQGFGGTPVDPNTPIPEPGTMMLLGSGLAGLASYGRKRFRK